MQYLSFNRPKGQAAELVVRRSGIQFRDVERKRVEAGCGSPKCSDYPLGWQDSTYRRMIPSLMSLRTVRSAATSLITARYSFLAIGFARHHGVCGEIIDVDEEAKAPSMIDYDPIERNLCRELIGNVHML